LGDSVRGLAQKFAVSFFFVFSIIKIFLNENFISYSGQIDRATVLYDQPPEFFRPASLEEKHKVKQIFLCQVLTKHVFIEELCLTWGSL
jgi:hypothetical protein